MANDAGPIQTWLLTNATSWHDIPLVIVGNGQWLRTARTVEKPIPGSNDSVTQTMGLAAWTVQHQVLFGTLDDYTAFVAAQGDTGALIVRPDTAAVPGRVSVILGGKRYDRIDNVKLASIAGQTYARDGGARCQATFSLVES